jgi:PTH2 family peptidyl-tRNA hydrolase
MIKQVIVMRKDLKMRRGKEIAQGSHASMSFLSRRLQEMLKRQYEEGYDLPSLETAFSDAELEWLQGLFTKVCLQVDSEDELVAVHIAALDAGLECHLIEDSGATEFHGVKTKTCLAIGPDDADKINEVTGHLKLY